MKRALLISTCLLFSVPAHAQQANMQSPAYKECSALATSNPAQALTKADAWLKIDTGIAAQHCRAMALYGLRRFPEAGDELSRIRLAIANDNISLRAYVTQQAAKAFLGANRADQALDILGAQIADISTLRNDNVLAAQVTADLLLERARVNVTYGKLDEAAKDLDHAVSLTPINTAVLMERAGVFEKLGDIPLARNDAQIVAKIEPRNTQARDFLNRVSAPATPAAPRAR